MRRARPLIGRPEPFDPANSALFVDFDGTLVELADRPEGVVVDRQLLELLPRIAQALGGALAIVSGRSLADLRQHLPDGPWVLVGQHGLERQGPIAGLTAGFAADLQTLPEELRDALLEMAQRHPQLQVEDKGMSVAVHYRAAPRLGGYLRRKIERGLKSYPELALLPGKRVFEVKPMGCSKGLAMQALMAEAPFADRRPLFVGDDITDETGFERANALGGASVKVGAGATSAHFRLRDVRAVHQWLRDSLLPEGNGENP